MGVTSTEATVSWTKLPRAESYKVYAVEHEGTAKALKAITDTGYILCIYDRRSKP